MSAWVAKETTGLPSMYKRLARSLAAQGRIPADLPGKFKGHAYLLYAHGNRPVIADGVMIIGDAAGLAYTQSGEGIRPAIESGLMAAVANVLAVNRDYRRERLSQYEAALQSRFGERGEAPALAMLPSKLRLAGACIDANAVVHARNVVLDRWFCTRRCRPVSSVSLALLHRLLPVADLRHIFAMFAARTRDAQ